MCVLSWSRFFELFNCVLSKFVNLSLRSTEYMLGGVFHIAAHCGKIDGMHDRFLPFPGCIS